MYQDGVSLLKGLIQQTKNIYIYPSGVILFHTTVTIWNIYEKFLQTFSAIIQSDQDSVSLKVKLKLIFFF